jgi:hypothetical protein
MATPTALDPEPLASTLALQASVPPARWPVILAGAHECVRILDAVGRAHSTGLSRRQALATVAPEVHWSTYLNWCRRAESRPGAPWERQLDVRVPPPPDRISAVVEASACALRRLKPTLTCAEARVLLVAQFGEEEGGVSDASLKRIWKEGGVAQPRGRQPTPKEVVTRLTGGGGLAFLAAAAAETGAMETLGAAVLAHAREVANLQSVVPPPAEVGGRDELGRFTGDYNRIVRGENVRDPRLDPDIVKRARRDLTTLSVLESTPAVIGRKLLAMGLTPLLTERRGLDGLEGPSGSWLAAAGGPAYQAATLDKFLSELALVDAGAALWPTHAEQWARVTAPWREHEGAPAWLRNIIYVDATQDPYWTRAYAVSGKVSRVNKVMPCLTRVAMMGGPGVPLAVETHAGAVSLKTALLPFLERMENVLGPGELGRLTVIDAEMATRALLTALAGRPDRWFISVLKGGTAKAAELGGYGTWQRYRDSDLLRELTVTFPARMAPEEPLRLRGVEMVREESRNPTSTIFITDATAEELPTEQVATAYLSRWPHQERRFRDARNGLGLDRSHGYGGHDVTHVALSTAQEKVASRAARAEANVVAKAAAEVEAARLLGAVEKEQRSAARAGVSRAKRERRAADRKLDSAQKEQQRLSTTPREIYVRDTTRDSIATCSKLTVLMLLEYALKEYFGNLHLEARTFIERFVHLPVTIRESKTEVIYEIGDNPRSPDDTARLRAACAEVRRRKIQVDGRYLRFEVAPAGPGSTRKID